jgi:hypothetical protein
MKKLVCARVLNATGESYLAMNARARVEGNLGADPFSYVWVQRRDNAQMSVWVFTVYGELRLCADPEAPHEQVTSHVQRSAHARLYRR